MVSDWEFTSIDDLKANSKSSIAIGPFGSRMKSDSYVDDGIPVIRGKNITGGPNFKGEFVYISEEKADSLGSSNVYKGDLVFPHRGAIGEVGILLEKKRFVISSSLMKLTCDSKKAFPKYLYYYFKSHIGKHELLKNSSSVGTPGIGQPLTSLKGITLFLPPLAEQKAIAHVLGALDDKIELNRRMNATLEGMAQALFKSWFVDFDPVLDNALAAGNPIPDALAERAGVAERVEARRQALADGSANREAAKPFPATFHFTEDFGWIPQGWEVSTIGEEVIAVGGGTPSTKNELFWNGTHPFCTPKDMSKLASLVLLDTKRCLTDLGVQKISSGLLPKGTLLMSSRAPIGYLAIAQMPVTINQGIIALLKNDTYQPMFLLNWLRLNMERVIERANGSTFLEIGKNNFRTIPFLKPSEDVLSLFNIQAESIHEKIISCVSNTNHLTKLRDTLLPKLISGELRIPDAQKLAEEALA